MGVSDLRWDGSAVPVVRALGERRGSNMYKDETGGGGARVF